MKGSRRFTRLNLCITFLEQRKILQSGEIFSAQIYQKKKNVLYVISMRSEGKV